MAVFRTRKESDPSGDVPSGPGTGGTAAGEPGGGAAPAESAPSDRTRSVVKKSAPVQRAPRTPGRTNMPGGAPLQTSGDSRSFVQDTITELKRVVWPSKEAVRAGTVVTIGLLIFFSLYIFGLDFLAERIFKSLGFYS